MSLPALPIGTKAYIAFMGVNVTEDGPVARCHYVVVLPDGTAFPGPTDAWFVTEIPFDYTDSLVTIRTKILAQILAIAGIGGLNSVLLF